MNKEWAISQFWASFGWKAYDENTVPDNALDDNGGHLITYNVVTAALDDPLTLYGRLYCRSNSWVELTAKKEEIERALGVGGIIKKIDGGYVWIRRSSMFSQRFIDEDDTVKGLYLQIEVEFFTKY